MIEIKDKKNCTGCNACHDICTQGAISLDTDIEGFWYPLVDADKCTNCGLCEKICPVIHINELKKNEFDEPICFAAIHKNIEVRFGSTTGGLFSAMAEQMYREGGYVGGAIYDKEFVVHHFISNNPNDLIRIRQSKYSQSQTCGFYKEVKKLLQAGEKVLVCGTPCQMAALRSYLHKEYNTLIIVDFICKSITSPKFYAKYLDYWERKAGSKLVSFKFKDKELGWRNLVKRFDFKNGKTLYSKASDNDLYSSAYHGHLVSRPSCYSCRFKGLPRMADITIADFWGVEKYANLRSLDDDAGTSAVIVNNNKGLHFFEKIQPYIQYIPATLQQIIPGNRAVHKCEPIPKADRDAFFRDLDSGNLEDVLPRHIHYFGKHKNWKQRIKQNLQPWVKAWRFSQHKPCVLLRFFWLNFFNTHVKTDWKNCGLIYPTPYSVIELCKNSVIELHGPLIVGNKRVRKSHEETRLLIDVDGRLVVHECFRIGYGSDVEVFKKALLDVGYCGTNYKCTIICGKKIEMRGRVSLGREVNIRDTNAHTIALEGYKVLRPVVIENHTWLCSGATICPGVKIKEGAIVGACSYVIQNVPAHSLVSGHPAKVVMKNIAWKL